MQKFDVEAARKSGYTDDDIIEHLTKTRKFDVGKAIGTGYSKQEIISHLSSAAPEPEVKSVPNPKGYEGRAGKDTPTYNTLTQPYDVKTFATEAAKRTGKAAKDVGKMMVDTATDPRTWFTAGARKYPAIMAGMGGGEAVKQIGQHIAGSPDAPETSKEALKRIGISVGIGAAGKSIVSGVSKIAANRTARALLRSEAAKSPGTFDAGKAAKQAVEDRVVGDTKSATVAIDKARAIAEQNQFPVFIRPIKARSAGTTTAQSAHSRSGGLVNPNLISDSGSAGLIEGIKRKAITGARDGGLVNPRLLNAAPTGGNVPPSASTGPSNAIYGTPEKVVKGPIFTTGARTRARQLKKAYEDTISSARREADPGYKLVSELAATRPGVPLSMDAAINELHAINEIAGHPLPGMRTVSQRLASQLVPAFKRDFERSMRRWQTGGKDAQAELKRGWDLTFGKHELLRNEGSLKAVKSAVEPASNVTRLMAPNDAGYATFAKLHSVSPEAAKNVFRAKLEQVMKSKNPKEAWDKLGPRTKALGAGSDLATLDEAMQSIAGGKSKALKEVALRRIGSYLGYRGTAGIIGKFIKK